MSVLIDLEPSPGEGDPPMMGWRAEAYDAHDYPTGDPLYSTWAATPGRALELLSRHVENMGPA